MVKVHHKTYKKASFVTGRNRAVRPKTFKTEESAKNWAKKQGIEKYTLENLKSPESSVKKIRINVQ